MEFQLNNVSIRLKSGKTNYIIIKFFIEKK